MIARTRAAPGPGARMAPAAEAGTRARQAGRGDRRPARRAFRQGAAATRRRRWRCRTPQDSPRSLRARRDRRAPVRRGRGMPRPRRGAGDEPGGAAPDAGRGDRARAGPAAGGAADASQSLKRGGGHAYRGAAPGAARLQAARRFADIPPLVEQLVRRKVFDSAQGEQVRIAAQREQLRALAHDAGGLRDTWNRLPDAARTQPAIARAAARSFLQLRRRSRGRSRSSANSLEREWDSDLVELYGECRPADATRQLEQAGAVARRAHPGRDAAARAGHAVPAAAALGQGADLSRGEPGARQQLAHAACAWASCSGRSARARRRTRTSSRRCKLATDELRRR